MLIKDTFFLLFMIAFSITVPFAIPAGASTEHSSNLHTEDRENNPVGMERDLNHPDIDVEPNAIEDEINSGESVERILNFSNLGDEAISFRIEYELINQPDRDLQNTRPTSFLRRINPQHDDPGDILFQLELNTINITGLDWDPDENVMWAASYDPEIIHAYTYNGAGEVENVFNQRLNERSKGVGYLRNIVYTIQYWTSFVFRFDRDGEALGELELDCDRVMDLATSQDEGWLLVFDGVNRDIHVYDVENDHQRIGVIDGGQVFGQMGGRWARSMCWVDDHPDGQLWLGSEDRVWQFYVDTENWHTDLVQDFETQAESALLAIGHDGNNIWRPTNRNDRLVQVYDDGITEVKWISIEPDEGDLEADSDIDVIVGLNATHLNGGEYELDLHFLSNDPDNPGVAVNVRLNVIGVPDLELEWSENRGFPEVIDWNRAFPDVYSGGPYEIPVSMTNEGTQVLNVEDVFSENEYFFFEFEQQFELQIGETIVGNFIFEGEEPGDYNTSMIIVSDDPDEERIEIDLHARALLPPIAILEPDAFNRDLFNDEEAQLEVVITNEGDNLLRWWSDFEIIGRREMDNLKSGRKVRSINGAERNPRRDQIEGRGLLLSEVCGWENWDFEQYFQAIDDLEYDRFHTWDEVGDIDFDDYDFMWIGNYETEGWVIDHNENLERIEEFVDNGGALYHSSGSNRHITRPVNPGGLVYTWGRINGDEVQDDCPLMLNPGDNFLINYMNENDDFDWEWREGQILAGSAHGVFNQRDINELENSNWSEIMAMGNPVEEPIIVTYQFGNGYVLASTTVDGYLHARQEEFPWGRTGVGVIHYLDFLTNFSKWATWDPHRGELQPDEDENVTIILSPEELVGGDYQANIHFYTNDPAQREFVVEITLQVTGLPIIEVEWSQEAGYPDSIDWNGVYDELFTGRDQPLRIEINNAGTDELNIEDISFDHEYFSSEQQELIVPPFDSRMLTLIISAEEDGEHEGILTILSNDPENAEWEIQVHGITSSTPVMELNPDEFDVALIEGESTEFEVIIANIGEALLSWGSVSEIVEEPEQDGDTRSIRHIRPKSIGPNRDPLENGAFEDLQFACFTTNDNWGWIGDGMRQDPLLNEDNFVSYRGANDLAEVDYWDYDGVVITLYNQQFMNQYNANLERLTDYIYDGGGAYFETGRVQRHQTPGGLSNDQNDRSDNGIFLVSPNPEDENYSLFARILHISEPDYWLEGEVIEGDAWLNSSYSHGQFERAVRNGDIDWFQPVASTQNDPDRWGAVTYGIGTGIILTVGHPPGDCWFNWAENGGQWGSIGAEILYYISRTTAQWLSWNPKQGEIPPGQNDRIIVTLETEGMRHGVYEANINLYSNDPVAPEGEPDQTVSIALEITGIGRIFVEPAGPEDNEPYDFGIGYIGFPKAAEFKITNVGTGVLTIEEAVTDNEVFYVDEEIEFPIILEINEELLINVLFNSREEVENQEATIVFVTDPPHFEWNDGYPINVTGDGFEPPFINVFPDDISGDFIDGDLAEFVLNVSNEGSNLLIWDTEFEALERPNRDNPQRTVRRIEDSSGPRRDNPGDILAQFNSGILNCGCMTSTHDGLVYGCAYRNNRIIGMNIENGRIVSNWEGPGAPMAITWTGEEFWIVERPNSVVSRFNIEGEMIGEFDLNMQSIQGLACDLENTVYALSITEDSIFLIDIETHDQMGAILYREALGNSFLNDIECVPNHDEGKLWAYNRGNVIQMAISEELIPRVVSEIDVPGEENWAGLGHDGEDLWVGMWETEIWYKIEDGIDEWELIVCDPAFGELEEGADIDVIATISIEEFPDGFYDGTLFFISNDPETPQVEISVRVSINGHPFITAEPVIPAPIVEEEEATIEFGDTFVDFEDSEFEIAILNIGDISLEIEEIVIDGEDAGAFTHNFEEEIEIPAREELEFILTFSPDAAGQKNATLILLTDAINVEDGIIWWNLTGLGQIVPDLENYVLPFDMEDAPDARHRLSVVELLWDNEHVPAGWEIGVFTETEELGGSAVWLGGGAVEFFAFGSEGDFAGFENGGRFSFKVWDNEADEDFEVGTTVRDGPETWEDGGETTLELDGGEITQLELELQESWNLISVNVDPRQFYGDDEERGPSVPLMFEQLEDEDGNQPIELLKDELGHFWVPEWNFINVDFWHLTQGYQICLTEEAEAVFQGRRIAPDAEISIKPGWNFIAYFPEFDLDASAPDFYVLSPIIDSVIRAKDGQGRFMSIEFQFSNMVPWTQGRGYHVNIDAEEPIVLIYPPEQDVAAVFGLDDYLENNISPVPSTRNMSILINSIDGVEPQVGDLISAYSSLGSKIGSGEFTSKRCGLAVWGDEENTEVIEGALKDEEIVLKFWDADKSVERNINVMSVLAGNGLTFESNGFIAIDVEVQTIVPENYYLSQNYPNPFNSTTRLTFGSPENAYVSVNVFDMNGRHFMELVNGTVEAGNHTVNWDAIDVSAGIYLVQMEASTGFRSIVKVILIK